MTNRERALNPLTRLEKGKVSFYTKHNTPMGLTTQREPLALNSQDKEGPIQFFKEESIEGDVTTF